jgi:hypothetical protein
LICCHNNVDAVLGWMTDSSLLGYAYRHLARQRKLFSDVDDLRLAIEFDQNSALEVGQ